MEYGKRRMWLFAIALIALPILLVLTVWAVLLYYGYTMDILSALVAAGTVELALLAGVQDRVRGWLSAPELDIEVSESDFHGTYDRGSKVYYSRFRVHNRGGASAEKVEVMLKRVYRKEGEKFTLDDSIPSDNLNWSMIGQWVTIPFIERDRRRILIQGQRRQRFVRKFMPAIYCDYIAPGTHKYSTLGHIYEPMFRDSDEYGTPRFEVPKEETVFCLELSFKSNRRYYFLRKGTYGIELQVAASNTRAITKRFRMEVTGNWFPDEEERMAREGFKIEEVKYDFDKYTEKVTGKQEIPSEAEAGTADKEEPAAETTGGSEQPSASDATSQTTTTDRGKKKKEETA